MEQFIGKKIDNYRILEVVNSGGMGTVFKALDESLDKVFALKMLDPRLAKDKNFLQRFLDEPKLQAKLDSPHIVAVHAFRKTASDFFIVMEYIEGTSLRERIKQHGRWPWPKALAAFKDVLAAIQYAHDTGVTHRDINPGNILIGSDGCIKVTDFGLAKFRDHQDTTATRVVAGTVKFMPPEQVRGLKNVDHRGDIYSLGMTLYYMLAARVPFEDHANDYEILRAIIEEQPAPPGDIIDDIPAALNNLILKAIEKAPEERFQTVAEMSDAVDQISREQTDSNIIAANPDHTLFPTLPEDNHPVNASPAVSEAGFHDESILRPALRFSRGGIVLLGLAMIILCGSAFFIPAVLSSTRLSSSETIADSAIGLQPVQSQQLEVFTELETVAAQSPGTTNSDSLRGSIQINSQPDGAGVWINDQMKGITPFRDDTLLAGTYSIQLKKAGFEHWFEEITLAETAQSQIFAQLKKNEPSTLILTSVPSCPVFVNGKAYPVQGNNSLHLAVPEGRQTVIFQHSQYGSKEVTITMEAGEHRSITCYFENYVNVQSLTERGSSQWATIFINGRDTEQMTPLAEYPLAPGEYSLGVYRSGFDTLEEDRQIIVEPDTIKISHSLVFTLREK